MTLLPTELVGSYALPSWLLIAEERQELVADLGASDVAELLDDAVNIAVFDQEQAGLDVLTDGEMRRRDFIQSSYQLIIQCPLFERRGGLERLHLGSREGPNRSARGEEGDNT